MHVSLSIRSLPVRPHPVATVMALVTVLLLTTMVGSVAAHSALESAEPMPGSTTTTVVDQLELRFGQAVDVLPGSVEIATPSGPVEPMPTSVLQPDGVTVVATLEAPLNSGAYTVQWRVIGGDGHPIEGEYVIEVTATAPADAGPLPEPGDLGSVPEPLAQPEVPVNEGGVATLRGVAAAAGNVAPVPAEQPDVGSDVGSGADTAQTVARWVAFLGILTAAGVVVFGLVVHPDSVPDRRVLTRLVLIGSVLAAVGSAVQLGAHVAVIAGDGAAGVFSVDAWGIVVGSGVFWAAVIRISAASLIGLAAGNEQWVVARPRGLLVAFGALALVLSFQLTGHTATSAPSIVVRVADAAHIIGAAVWTGGVVALASVMAARRHRGSPNALIVGQFSVAATGAVILVGLAGLALTFVELDSISALFTTSYGQVLLGKVGVVAVVGAIGGFNHRQLVPAIVAGRSDAAARMQRTMRIELLLFPIVLALSAVLVALSP